MRTFIFKMYHAKRNKHLHRSIDLAGRIYNHLIALHRRYYRLFGKHLGKSRLQKHITKLKKTKRFSFWNELNSQAIQQICDRIENAYTLFYRNLKRHVRTAPPSFRKVKKYRSFTLKQSGYKFQSDSNKVTIMGREYRFFKSRDIEGKIATVTVKRDAIGDLWLFVVVEEQAEIPQIRTGNSAGLDFGLKTFLTRSDGVKITSPLFFKQDRKHLVQLCRKLSSKKKGSRNREKARLALAREYRRIADRRRDFHFKTALALAKEFAQIAVEDLNMKAMQRLWGRKISDLGHASFVKILEWECRKHGTKFVMIDRFAASSKTCHVCGEKYDALTLKERHWKCAYCGTEHDRDINAAINILSWGVSS